MTFQKLYDQFGIGQQASAIDANGVCMAAIQGLHRLIQQQATVRAQQATQSQVQTIRLQRLQALLNTQIDPSSGHPHDT